MNTSAKGAKLERLAIAILEKQGYQVRRTIRSPIKGLPNDIFGADLLAIKDDERIRAIQVTTWKVGITEKKREYARWNWPGAHASVEVWLWMARPAKGLAVEQRRSYEHFSVRKKDHGYSHKAAERLFPRDFGVPLS